MRVRSLLEIYEDSVSFYAPDICFADGSGISTWTTETIELYLREA